MKIKALTITLSLFSFVLSGQQPLTPDISKSASLRWLEKKVLSSRLIDNMETTGHWIPFTTGAITVVDARETAKTAESEKIVSGFSLSEKQAHGGKSSMRVSLPTRMAGPGPKSGRGWGTAGVWCIFDNEDWSDYNRISVWIRPDCPGAWVNWLELRLFNEGKEKLPALFGQEGETTVMLENDKWNHIVWEIGNVARDRISKLEVSWWMPGNEPEASDSIICYFDDLELQKVDPDYIEGWKVWPGRISYSHSGYRPEFPKSAIATNLTAENFRVINTIDGSVVLEKALKIINPEIGNFQIMDFSELQKPGTYIIKAGNSATYPFRIDKDVWEKTVWKALNFFYCERCGTAIPGIHGVCHRDWVCIHDDKKIVINGGWHDAGDLTQGLRNTAEATYAMFRLAEQLNKKGIDPELFTRTIDEARWGLDWILKTSFGDGFRNEGSVNSRRTNGIIGDYDDVTSTARNTPRSNFIASASEAIGYRILLESDPRTANYSLRSAKADWQFAVDKLDLDGKNSSEAVWSGSFDSGNVLHETASAGILASVELYKATGEKAYADKAVDLAEIIIESQQRKRTDWDVPLSGFFYTGPDRKHILHYCHNGREQEPIAALANLCEALPDHPDWMKWYSAVVLHSEYLKKIAKYSEPYGVMPSSVYTGQEYLQVPESRKESFRLQVLNGIPLGKGHYLRRFPVWMDYRGHFGTILPQAQALNYAAHLRNDRESIELAVRQLEWISGKNPFSQGTMYGEGYDYAPLYTPSSGDIVGALPVGIQSRGENDAPYWPVQSTWTYKEVWVHPVSQWIGVISDLAGPVLVTGRADSRIEFRNIVTGDIGSVSPDTDGNFRALLSQGDYRIISNGLTIPYTFLTAGNYDLDLRSENVLGFEVSSAASGKEGVVVTLNAQGNGMHRFSIRTSNLAVKTNDRQINLKNGKPATIKWSCKIEDLNEDWIAAIIPDGKMVCKKEVKASPE